MGAVAKMIEEICLLAGEKASVKETIDGEHIRLELFGSEIDNPAISMTPINRELSYKLLLKGVKNYYKKK